MDLDRAQESLRAAEMCLRAGYANSTASRAYYAMFQAAQVALEHVGSRRVMWSHAGLQAAFATECIHRRKIYPAIFRNHLAFGLEVRQEADYGRAGVSQKAAQRLLQRALAFVSAVEEAISRGTP
jgi:uncharacterized protein (UPF0332 family)